jgi:hypothetical protein
MLQSDLEMNTHLHSITNRSHRTPLIQKELGLYLSVLLCSRNNNWLILFCLIRANRGEMPQILRIRHVVLSDMFSWLVQGRDSSKNFFVKLL